MNTTHEICLPCNLPPTEMKLSHQQYRQNNYAYQISVACKYSKYMHDVYWSAVCMNVFHTSGARFIHPL